MTLWLALPALSRYFGLHDATVATIACVTGAAGLTLPASLQFNSNLNTKVASYLDATTLIDKEFISYLQHVARANGLDCEKHLPGCRLDSVSIGSLYIMTFLYI